MTITFFLGFRMAQTSDDSCIARCSDYFVSHRMPPARNILKGFFQFSFPVLPFFVSNLSRSNHSPCSVVYSFQRHLVGFLAEKTIRSDLAKGELRAAVGC